jgi:hypothetical protein
MPIAPRLQLMMCSYRRFQVVGSHVPEGTNKKLGMQLARTGITDTSEMLCYGKRDESIQPLAARERHQAFVAEMKHWVMKSWRLLGAGASLPSILANRPLSP